MLIYLVIAISFALSSSYFIHIRGLRLFNKPVHIIDIMVYIIFTSICFPYIFLFWILDSDGFVMDYGDEYGQ